MRHLKLRWWRWSVTGINKIWLNASGEGREEDKITKGKEVRDWLRGQGVERVIYMNSKSPETMAHIIMQSNNKPCAEIFQEGLWIATRRRDWWVIQSEGMNFKAGAGWWEKSTDICLGGSMEEHLPHLHILLYHFIDEESTTKSSSMSYPRSQSYPTIKLGFWQAIWLHVPL